MALHLQGIAGMSPADGASIPLVLHSSCEDKHGVWVFTVGFLCMIPNADTLGTYSGRFLLLFDLFLAVLQTAVNGSSVTVVFKRLFLGPHSYFVSNFLSEI